MTLSTIATLFATMIVLAAIPSMSVLTVSARSAASGFMHGVSTTLGIVVGDIVFIVIAIYGLSVVADTSWFVWVKYLGGTYLIWQGISLWGSQPKVADVQGTKGTSLPSSFLAGLLITLADQKAILFYLGFFPAFLDLSRVSLVDTGIVIAIATIAIGIAKLGYAFLAVKAGGLVKNSRTVKGINHTAGLVMIGVGVFLLANAGSLHTKISG